MRSERIKFEGANGQKLAARLELPAHQHPNAYAIFAHCFTCSKNLNAVKLIAQSLTLEGFGVLRFDFTGLGESEGDFADTNFSSNIQDLLQAAKFLEENYQAPKLLIGHSLGGAAVLCASDQLDYLEAVATIGAPASPHHVQHLFQDSLEVIRTQGTAKVTIGGRPFEVKSQFLDDISGNQLDGVLKRLRKPLLILHSPQDTTVELSNASEIYQKAFHPKSFVSLDKADHLLTRKEDALYVGNVIANWAHRYVQRPEAKELSTEEQVVVRIGKEGYTTEIMADHHQLIADEPESVGGNDFGPSPYEYLLSSLGACTAMTLRMYADHKKWPLDEVIVHLSHSRDYAEDCAHCEDPKQKMDHIKRGLEVFGDLTEEQRGRMVEIANKCPVHKLMEKSVHIDTYLQ